MLPAAGAASNIQPNAVLKKIPVTIVVGGGMTVGGIVMSIFFSAVSTEEANWTTLSALFTPISLLSELGFIPALCIEPQDDLYDLGQPLERF